VATSWESHVRAPQLDPVALLADFYGLSLSRLLLAILSHALFLEIDQIADRLNISAISRAALHLAGFEIWRSEIVPAELGDKAVPLGYR
jgi:hypothetical protein